MKVVSIIRYWKNGAILSLDNLETSGISKCFFDVRYFWEWWIYRGKKHIFILLVFWMLGSQPKVEDEFDAEGLLD